MGRYTRKGYELDQTGQEAQDLLNAINNKVDKEDGKSLISDEDKAKLDDIEEGAQRNAIETIKRNGVALPINDKGVNISVPTKVADLEQDYTHRTVTDAEKDKWNDKQEKPAPVRYAVLKSMRDTGGLTVGKTYRITDYVATVRRSAQYSEAMSANHPFDIIVTAIDERHLSEECLAAPHEGDTYFANSDLSAWKIWYTIDNDTATYDWADPINGKGVVYRMIDEYANDVGYDFKGILIARHPVTPAEGYEDVLADISGMWLGPKGSAVPAGITVDTTQAKWFYTFSHLTDGWDNPTDASLRKGISAVYNVTITPIMRSNSRFLSGNVFMGGPFVVSTLVAMGASVEEVGTSHAMHFRAMGDCSGNSFFGYTGSSDCMSQLRHNIFVGEFRHNRFATDVEGNTIVAPDDISFNDMWCANMVVRARVFSYNSGGGYTLGTVLKTSENVSYNKFPNYFADNRITAAGNISANDFGASFYQNTFTLTGQFTGNKFTGYCYENNIGCSNFTNNEAAYFHANTISTTEGVNACVFGPYFESNTLGGRLTNVRFSSGQTRFCNFSGIVGCTFDGVMEYVTVPTVSGKRFTHCDVRGGVRGTSSVPVVLDYDAFFLASAAGVSRRVTIEGSADGKIVAMWADGGALKGVMKAPNGNWADMGFVTKAVNDLLNYYLKSETYTKTEVNQLVAGINNWEIVSVAQLPEASADTMHKIYLVPSSSPEASNVKDEYITIENSGIYSWEQIGSTTIDLTNYVTKQEFTIALADYVTSSAFTQALATKQDTLVSGQNIKTINGFSILGGGDLYFPGPVQSDWNEDDDGDDAYIKNKPTDMVKYTEQELTEAQKAQARTNIAAASESEVSQLRSEVSDAAYNKDNVQSVAGKWKNNNGVVVSGTSSTLFRFNPIPIISGKQFTYTTLRAGLAGPSLIIADSYDNVLVESNESNGTMLAPEHAAKLYFNSTKAGFSCTISGILNSFPSLEKTVSKLSGIDSYIANGKGVEGPIYLDEFEQGNIDGNNGQPTSSTKCIRTVSPVNIYPGCTLSYSLNQGYSLGLAFYDYDGSFIIKREWFSGSGNVENPGKSYLLKVVIKYSSDITPENLPDAGLVLRTDHVAKKTLCASLEEVKRLESLIGEFGVYPSNAQKPADGSSDSDFDAENITPQELYDAFDGLAGKICPPLSAIYPKYITEYYKEGDDATETYKIKAYVLTKRDRFAWLHADKLYAWKNGNTVVYIDSCSPRIGDTIYSDDQRTDSGMTVASYDSSTQSFTSSSSSVFTRSNTDNVAADILFSKELKSSGDLALFNRSDASAGTATLTDQTHLTVSGKSYVRCDSFDYHTATKGTIVLWANEHGAQSDPYECSITMYNLARDLTLGGFRNNEFLLFLKDYIKVVIIPCANPYSMYMYATTKREGRFNANGVNLNRNYDTPGWVVYSGEPKGNYAGDQNETQFIMNTCLGVEAALGIDVHCLSYTTEANQGKCHHSGRLPSSTVNSKVRIAMQNYGLEYSNYGDADPETGGAGKDWLLFNGIVGGLIEMNAGPYASAFNGKQHSSFFLEADYTLLLNAIKMWWYGINPKQFIY